MTEKQSKDKRSTSDSPSLKKTVVMNALSSITEGISNLSDKEEVEGIAGRVLDSLPESIGLRMMIDDARKSGNRTLEETLIAKNRALFDDIYAEISLIAGVENDTQKVSRENEEYRYLLLDRINNYKDEVNEDNILEVLGMLTRDEKEKLKFTFPQELFPPHIQDKWNHYADIVARHTTAIVSRNQGLENDVQLIAQLDAVRTVAHNNLSNAIKDFLALEEWDLERCRRLVIKMRDSLYPTIETAEKEVTSQEVFRLLEIIKKIRKESS